MIHELVSRILSGGKELHVPDVGGRFQLAPSISYIAEQTFGDSATRESNAIVSLKADIDYFMTEVNEMYATLLPLFLNITILKHIVTDFLTINLFSNNVESAVALKAFREWLKTRLPLASDADILWTGLNKVRNFSSNTSNFNNFNSISNFDTTIKNLNSFKTIDSSNSFSIIINSLNKFNTVRDFNNFSTPSNFTPTINSQIMTSSPA
ncbi:hypothetical protein PoB_004877800 [Plakobranchus ocellatus]|uniref:Uncharacterized protein n=1 Tax=Plakobranchus ocellatus TaxID=259542 RepID=A0AAV4BU02_9GAST|nr:hypothetical protein PoB_004877800 [Plakobranchus ocellatus]